ncbi:MAG: beta-ketoacyl-[acyl-carrier-protein] synthase II, partial [SAR324 cluster bacterium]|nr:beta-ketoacyl-[acyl-carrier-protein] synthase II [SAR324 cluster bacterium]
MERVVVTGLGVVSCVGCDVASFWAALTAGRSGIEPISAYDPAPYEVRIAGEAKDFTFDARLGKRMDRFTQFALTAAKQALEQAGLMPEGGESQGVNPERI